MTPPRPPRPPGSQSKSKFGSKSGSRQADDDTASGSSKGGRQIGPTLAMLLLVLGAGVTYLSVRGGRAAVAPPPKEIQLPGKAGELQFELPDKWKQAKMGDVAGASERWALGPKGARLHAMFITRYPLRRKPKDDEEKKIVRLEAQAALARTGGPAKPKLREREKIDGQEAWRYAFRAPGTWFDIWLVLHESDKQAALYQFSCQSPSGRAGLAMRAQCAEVLDKLKFGEEA